MEEALALAEADENEQIIGLAKKNGAGRKAYGIDGAVDGEPLAIHIDWQLV